MAYEDLRDWLTQVEALGELRLPTRLPHSAECQRCPPPPGPHTGSAGGHWPLGAGGGLGEDAG
jgi:hypothetical protein